MIQSIAHFEEFHGFNEMKLRYSGTEIDSGTLLFLLFSFNHLSPNSGQGLSPAILLLILLLYYILYYYYYTIIVYHSLSHSEFYVFPEQDVLRIFCCFNLQIASFK